jgi:hypothetical protein
MAGTSAGLGAWEGDSGSVEPGMIVRRESEEEEEAAAAMAWERSSWEMAPSPLTSRASKARTC